MAFMRMCPVAVACISADDPAESELLYASRLSLIPVRPFYGNENATFYLGSRKLIDTAAFVDFLDRRLCGSTLP